MKNETMRIRHAFAYALLTIALLVGTYARMTHIDRKLFFQDEAFTALRVSGHSERLYRIKYFTGRVHTAGEIAALMTRDPTTGVGSVLKLIAEEDPHHAPLFYVLERLTIDALGSSIVDYRALAVCFGLLTIGAAYFFGRTALGSPVGGAILAALVAVSPFHILYSQMAREYSLFACITLVSSTFLLRAIERRTFGEYAGYSVGVAVGMYTDPLFILVVVAQAVCAIVALRNERRAIVAWFGAVAVAGALFFPWALNALARRSNVEDQLSWGAMEYPLRAIAQKWLFNIGAVFFDAEFAHLVLAPIALVAVAIVAVSFAVVLTRTAETPSRSLAIALTFVPIVAFAAGDAIFGAHFALIPRYLSASWLGVEIVTASAISFALQDGRLQRVGYAGFAFLVISGATSAAIDAGYANWWTNNDQVAFQLVAGEINQAHDPLIVSEAHWHVPLVLAWYLHPSVPMLLFTAPKLPHIPPHAATFLVTPTPEVFSAFSERISPHATLTNVSPDVHTVIDSFHDDLRSNGKLAATKIVMSTHNALWLAVPLPASRGR